MLIDLCLKHCAIYGMSVIKRERCFKIQYFETPLSFLFEWQLVVSTLFYFDIPIGGDGVSELIIYTRLSSVNINTFFADFLYVYDDFGDEAFCIDFIFH